MTVTEFINKYNVRKDKEKLLFLSDRIIKNYIPIKEKVKSCETISSLVLNNQIAQYMMYMLMLIEIYTDISITYYNTENMFNADSEYDRLKSSGTLDLIVSQIPESELSELNFIMECLCDHKDDNSCSWNDFVSNVMRLMRNNDGK